VRVCSYAARFQSGTAQVFGVGDPSFTLCVRDRSQLDFVLKGDTYSVAVAFIRGQFDICGDFIEAIRHLTSVPRRGVGSMISRLASWCGPWRLGSLFQSRTRAARNIRFHYDRSNAFYRQFLDSRMVYSCAYFKDAEWNIEQAQEAKLDYICRKLDLQCGDRFLDVGCGWGGLVIHAAARYGVQATGCTLSTRQADFASSRGAGMGLQGRASIVDKDFRDLGGSYDKIASIGMFEHVGRQRLLSYFKGMYALLSPQGLFLNHGITRPQLEGEGPESRFVRRRVFPGGELAHLSDVVRQAERAGFELLDVENMRPHYSLTCKAWARRLEQNAEACLCEVGSETYRTWLLYLSACSISFEEGHLDVYQVLLAKRGNARSRRLSREYMYGQRHIAGLHSDAPPGPSPMLSK
jgi:cyclopropane-fatty-acyl-phospholipid synthase